MARKLWLGAFFSFLLVGSAFAAEPPRVSTQMEKPKVAPSQINVAPAISPSASKSGSVQLDASKLKPDLSCVISGSYEFGDKVVPIKNGGSSIGADEQRIRIDVANKGTVSADKFTVVVKVNGAFTSDPLTYSSSLGANITLTKTIKIRTPAVSHDVAIKAVVDAEGKINESNKANNSCEFKYTAMDVH